MASVQIGLSACLQLQMRLVLTLEDRKFYMTVTVLTSVRWPLHMLTGSFRVTVIHALDDIGSFVVGGGVKRWLDLSASRVVCQGVSSTTTLCLSSLPACLAQQFTPNTPEGCQGDCLCTVTPPDSVWDSQEHDQDSLYILDSFLATCNKPWQLHLIFVCHIVFLLNVFTSKCLFGFHYPLGALTMKSFSYFMLILL